MARAWPRRRASSAGSRRARTCAAASSTRARPENAGQDDRRDHPSFGERYLQTTCSTPTATRAVTRSTSDSRAGDAGEGARTRDEKKALQRRHILDAAREVFFRDGFIEGNLDEVAERAGVAKGTLYRYFENKAELYVAVLSQNGELFEQRMREAVAGGGGPAESIRRLGRFYREHWVAHPEYFRIFWAIENQEVIGALPAAVVAEVTKLWEQCLRILSDVIRAGVEGRAFRPCDEWLTARRALDGGERAHPGRADRRPARDPEGAAARGRVRGDGGPGLARARLARRFPRGG